MPPFQTPMNGAGQKRKSDGWILPNAKRPALDDRQWPGHGGGSSATKYWMVQWRVPQTKKHKTWDGDAVLVAEGSKCTLYDTDGKVIGNGSHSTSDPFREGLEFKLASKELEVDHAIPAQDFLSGACFGRGVPVASSAHAPKTSILTPVRSVGMTSSAGPSKQFRPPLSNYSSKPKSRGIPLQPVDLVSQTGRKEMEMEVEEKPASAPESHWTANWRKHQSKKNKTWDGDAFVSHIGNKVHLISEEGKILGTTAWKGLPMYSTFETRIGGKDVILDRQIASSELPTIVGKAQLEYADAHDEENDDGSAPVSILMQPNAVAAREGNTSPSMKNSDGSAKKFIAPQTFYGKPAPKPAPKGPLHDPSAENAIVLKAPTKEHEKKFNKKNLPIVPVVLDPMIARHLRPHQVEGVKFLYECVMGLRKHEGQGCILADEMGLGKTLQTICLVWTLLRQNPYRAEKLNSVIGKALIVCPVTLVNNWKAEFHKWLGRDRVGVFTGDKDKGVIKQFINSKIHHVLIIGYEKLRTVIDDLAYCQPPIGLIICDEGHRLKSANNKTSAMFKALRTPRRVILSGTPIQNDLSEFHAMADFCNPGLLDDYSTFRRVYEAPILKSRAPDSTPKENEIGEARSAQLLNISKSFVLRREATILKNYLPPKHEYVVFVTPTPLQLSIFSTILNADKLDDLAHSSTAESLALIGMLTKISNSPILLKATADKAKGGGGIKRAGVEEALKLLPSNATIEDFSLSGKLFALSNLLKAIRANTEEKCILVSHYTSTLNILEAFCKKRNYTYFRLDGQTPAAKRQEYVNIFNNSSQQSRFLFLLSSKAGGVGLNLIGASRLCLIDSDWNPSHDLQSMARIHRDGQKRPVFIYRLLTAGTIDEKIYQRQVTKIGLSNCAHTLEQGNSGSKSDSFSRKDLRDIFRVHPDTACNTHDLLECSCGGAQNLAADGTTADAHLPDSSSDDPMDEDDSSEKGFVNASQVKPEMIDKMDKAYLKKKKEALAALGEWNHISCLRPSARDDIHDDILRKLIYVPKPTVKEKAPVEHKSRAAKLLAEIDLENVAAMEEENAVLGVKDVPGGTVCFLFEKGSKAAPIPDAEDAEEEDED
ncbi:hypothetical protein PLICRDRAFT_50591 [Plicaturopsis crispa FD-325 SS-3]|nr:hypothetical protein PLICRDRAFT_50591 [Plicaturopsis crispa FD-325 SS-3]